MKPILAGCSLLFGGHAVAVGMAWLLTRALPLNIHVVVLALLGIVQLVYAVPLIAFFLFKRRRSVALGVVVGAILTAIMSGVGLSL